ncbi:polymorphic toxin-type HINT domain-containing protein [Novipirellula artificiosorum]|uniref:Hint domain-containing protein n=1 Tax=Novipirellula artificiosorum TaxID=2528016 RepID=A0A5C6D7U9_9BACT|nr:polymorphic toxin-type HINT domain-containing protein [Novipirellula artificiosorum]TWU32878.1 hypothetical protein Poly41_52550 [Novipirellula artificiosorum]
MFTLATRWASVNQVSFGVGAAVFFAPLLSQAWSAESTSIDDPVRAALEAEAEGRLIDRTLLASEIGTVQDPESARWHAGQVCVDGVWLKIDQLSEARITPVLERYRQQRGEEVLDADGHRRVAAWADLNGLKTHADAHWQGALAENPNDRIVRSRLGYERVGDEWLTKQEIRQAEVLRKDRARQTRAWIPKMKAWANSLLGTDAKRKIKTIEAIGSVDDPSAIDALQLTALQLPGEVASPFVDAIRGIRCNQSCNALAEIAIADPGSKRGRAAIEGLKDYRMEFYVPKLIRSLSSDIRLRYQVFSRPNGDEILRLVKSRDLQNVNQIEVIDRVVQAKRVPLVRFSEHTGQAQGPGRRRVIFQASFGNPVAGDIARQDAMQELERARLWNESNNLMKPTAETRTLDVLQAVVSEEVGETAADWWGWWDRYNERVRSGDKPYEVRYDEDRQNTVYTQPFIARVWRSHSCLTAGTRVQTEFGAKPIETIQAGDLVLSQDVRTGELALKPVLATTHRPTAKTLRFVTAGGPIETTLGHYWWVAGKGWLRSKELTDGMVLHHATGTTQIEAIEASKPAESYNLVVADFHTYFVGPERILSYDVTDLSPTLQVVPGLPVDLAAN